MKQIINLFYLLVISVLMLSCSNENPSDPTQDNPEVLSDAYFSVKISQAIYSRVSEEGTENPSEVEKAIKNLTLVFVDESGSGNTNGKVIAVSETATPEDNSSTGSFTQKFKVWSTNIKALSGKSNVGIYVVCNYLNLSYNLSSDGVQKTLTYDEDNSKYWNESDGFLMSNQKAVKVSETLPTDWSSYTETAPYVITPTIKVQRAMARFDISSDFPQEANFDGIKVKITEIAMVNISKNFFLFKEVGTTGSFNLLEEEDDDKYVNDPKADAKEKLNNNSQETDFTTLFLSPAAITTPKSLTDWTSLNNLTSSNNQAVDQSSGKEYKVWRYATPNTVTNKDKQLNGNTTGIVFKAELSSEGSPAITGWGTSDMIALDNKIYGDLTAVKNIASSPQGAEQQRVAYLYKSIQKDSGDPSNEELTSAGFKVYPVNDGKYYAYYYYWNRHNKIEESTTSDEMKAMDFGVVRNNIYKLAVTKISGLGLPEDQKPKAENPNFTKDNDSYFTVTVEIVPWEVRTFDIEF